MRHATPATATGGKGFATKPFCRSARPEEDAREDGPPQGHAVAVTTQEASDGSRERTMRLAKHRETTH